MQIRAFISCLFLLCSLVSFGTGTVTGVVYDGELNEPLYGANVMYEVGKGTTTDFDGKFSMELPNGQYTITVTYIGFQTQQVNVRVSDNSTKNLTFTLQPEVLKEVQVVADYAIDRETPVAFSNIDIKTVQEELASRDIPMLLNSTPGVYATQQGGGDGDARITIRGFDQRNTAVMIDGIPVNDMENGAVYWSNWSGLDVVTSTMQVQRGLGASKLAIPSIGGTINIITRGIDAKPGLFLRQEVGNDGYVKSSLGYSSGRTAKGWGLTLAGSFRRRDGWVDQTGSIGGMYFARVDKAIGDHIISVIGSGGPQRHDQRSSTEGIYVYDKDYAAELGVDTGAITASEGDFGYRYNRSWGFLNRRTLNETDTIDGEVEKFNTQYNYYHKPQVSVRHSWQINEKIYWSNIAYVSIGRGGGARPLSSMFIDTETGQTRVQEYWDLNNKLNAMGERRSSNPMVSLINSHFWVGGLSTLDINVNEDLNISTGLDVRSYKGIHQTKIDNLFGGDYFQGSYSAVEDPTTRKYEGDLVARDYDGIVRWGGLFGQVEYKKDNWSTFFSGSFSLSAYNRIDRWAAMDLVLADTTMKQILGSTSQPGQNYTDVVNYNGQSYTINSPEARVATTPWQYIPAYTLKAGINYKFTLQQNAFINAGYLSRNPNFSNVITFNNDVYQNVQTEKILAFEMGHGMRYPKFAMNTNLYYTIWLNRPTTASVPNLQLGVNVPVNFNDISAEHRGVEVDFSYKIIKQLTFEGLISVGDWRWTSGDTVNFTEIDQRFGDEENFRFDADGVKVGNAAQTQLGAMIRIEPIKNLYIKPRFTFFGRHWSNFNAVNLQGENQGRQSWRVPDYYTLDVYTGYTFRFDDFKLGVTLSFLNVTNNFYISDAQNNGGNTGVSTQEFDAANASVFFGTGFQWNIGLRFDILDFKRNKPEKE